MAWYEFCRNKSEKDDQDLKRCLTIIYHALAKLDGEVDFKTPDTKFMTDVLLSMFLAEIKKHPKYRRLQGFQISEELVYLKRDGVIDLVEVGEKKIFTLSDKQNILNNQ